MRSNESSEDYLETILILGNRSSLVRAVDIAAEMERHQLISSWLMILGVQEKTAIHDACRIEHIISEESFQALKKAVYELREQQAVLHGETADQV